MFLLMMVVLYLIIMKKSEFFEVYINYVKNNI